MLYELLEGHSSHDFELVSIPGRSSLPSSTCIDDERDTERRADVWATCFEGPVFGGCPVVCMLRDASSVAGGLVMLMPALFVSLLLDAAQRSV
jgi:hypothetical protein